MPRMIVKYLLEGDGTVPKWIQDGGYFSDGHYMIGLTVDSSERRVPSDVVPLTEEELKRYLSSVEHLKNKDSAIIDSITNSFLKEKKVKK